MKWSRLGLGCLTFTDIWRPLLVAFASRSWPKCECIHLVVLKQCFAWLLSDSICLCTKTLPYLSVWWLFNGEQQTPEWVRCRSLHYLVPFPSRGERWGTKQAAWLPEPAQGFSFCQVECNTWGTSRHLQKLVCGWTHAAFVCGVAKSWDWIEASTSFRSDNSLLILNTAKPSTSTDFLNARPES